MTRMLLVSAVLLLIAPAARQVDAKVRAGVRGVPAKTQIKLISAGAVPRRTLRYRFQPGQVTNLRMSMKMAMGMELAGRRVPAQTLPTMEMQMRIRVLKSTPGGNATLKFYLSGVTVKNDSPLPPFQIQNLRKQMRALKGFTGTSVVTSRGTPVSSSFKVPPGVSAQSRQVIQNLQQQMKQLTAILPVQPVGLGARWNVRIPMHGPPLSFVSELTYELKALRANSADVRVKVAGWAPAQKMYLPNMPSGASARIRSLKAQGTGNMRIDFTRPKATGRLAARQTVDSVISVMGRDQSMKMNMNMSVRFQ